MIIKGAIWKWRVPFYWHEEVKQGRSWIMRRPQRGCGHICPKPRPGASAEEALRSRPPRRPPTASPQVPLRHSSAATPSAWAHHCSWASQCGLRSAPSPHRRTWWPLSSTSSGSYHHCSFTFLEEKKKIWESDADCNFKAQKSLILKSLWCALNSKLPGQQQGCIGQFGCLVVHLILNVTSLPSG